MSCDGGPVESIRGQFPSALFDEFKEITVVSKELLQVLVTKRGGESETASVR